MLPHYKDTLDALITLLSSVGESNWLGTLENLRVRSASVDSPHDLHDLMSDTLRIFGGMASFSDLVLYRDGRPDIVENVRLDKLRTRLFQLARMLR